MMIEDKLNNEDILIIKDKIENNNYEIIDEYINYLTENESDNLLSLLCLFIEQISPKNIFDVIDYLMKNSLVTESLNNIEDSDVIENRVLMLLLNACRDNINLYGSYSDNLIKIYFNEIGMEKLLSYEEERELLLKIKNGDLDAKQKFICANLRLVVSFAKKFIGRGVDFLDLIQEGNLGIMKAVEKYDLSKGFKFSTYASYWINNYLYNVIYENSRQIRLPNNVYSEYIDFLSIQNKLKNELRREPSIAELAMELNCTMEKINEFYLKLPNVISYNELIYDNNGDKKELIHFIPSDEMMEEELVNRMYYGELYDFLKEKIKPKNFEIFLKRNGLGGKEKSKLRQLAEEYNVSTESIRGLDDRTKKKMQIFIRNSSKFKDIADEESVRSKNDVKPKEISFEERALMFSKIKGREKYVQTSYKFPDGISMKTWFSFNKELIRSLNTEVCLNIINEYDSYFHYEESNINNYVEIIVKKR